jgi:antitoxin FitA
MTSVLIRNVNKTLHARLKARAAANHRSLEEEARELLRAGLARQEAPARENLAALARRLFGPGHGADLEIPPRGSAPETIPPDFSAPEYE